MANLRVIAEIKPAGDFPVVDAPNVSVTGGKRLDVALSEAAAEVAKKANKSEVDTALASKANKSEVDAALAGKANKSEVDAAIENKADKSAFEAINASVSVNTSNIQELSTESTVLSARMDEFTKLEEGSTTGDAELIDGRVSADGKTYDNIGGAIRGQVTDLKSDLTNIDDLEKERKIPFISAYSKSLNTTNYICIVLPSSILQNKKLLSFDVYCEDDVRPYLMMYDCDMSLVGNDRLTKRIGSSTYTDVKTGNWYHYENNIYTLLSLPSKEKIALVFNLVPNDSVKRIIEGYICNIKLGNNICDTKIEDVFLYSESPTAEDKVNLYNVGLIEYISNIEKINELEKGEFDFKKLGSGKILCIGDSLTAGVYSNETTPREENYPYFMKRIISNESINAGFPGYSTSMIWDQNKLQSVDFTDVKHIIIMLGTNGGLTDTLETDVYAYDDYHDYATTKTGCYCKIIEYCMEQAPTAHIYLCTTPFFDKIRKPNYAPPTTPDANIVIPKIAEFYGLRVFDVRNGLGVNSKNTNTIQLDGLHGQKEFYERLGTFIGSQLRANASWVE